MLGVLLSGTLIADPKERTTSTGKPYATASMRVPAEDAEAIVVSVIAFAPGAVEALLALGKGEPLSVAGRAKLSSWEKDGERRLGLSVVADRVLTAYAAGRARKAARSAEPEQLEIPAPGLTRPPCGRRFSLNERSEGH